MMSFGITVPLYARYRLAYPAALVEEVARRTRLTAKSRALDLACGPGFLALACAPLAGEVVGIDREPAMLEAAKAAAKEAGAKITWIEARAEEALARDELGRFQLVTIGRALHWMDQSRVLALLHHRVEEDGAIALFVTRTPEQGVNPWSSVWHDTVRRWISPQTVPMWHPHADLDERYGEVLAASPFPVLESLSRTWSRQVTQEELIGRALSMVTPDPGFRPEHHAPFEAELRAGLAPFLRDGLTTETAEALALIARRS